MALRFNGTTTSYVDLPTASANGGQSFSILFHVQWRSFINFDAIWNYGATAQAPGGPYIVEVLLDATSAISLWGFSGQQLITGPKPAVGEWWTYAIKCDNTSIWLYWKRLGQQGFGSGKVAMSTPFSQTPNQVWFGRDTDAGQETDLSLAGVKWWKDRVLTAQELEIESHSMRAVSRGRLFGEWPLNGVDLRDTSGNGRTLRSGGGTLAGTAAPPLGRRPVLIGALHNMATPLAVGAIVGATTLSVAPSGTLLGAGALAGTTTATITPAGTLVGAGALAGTTALGITTTGTTGSGAIIGATTLSVTPTGTLVGAGALAGTTPLTITPAATLAGAGAMAGTTTLSVAPTGTALAIGALAGTTALGITTTGTARAIGALTGTTTLTLTPAGLPRVVNANWPWKVSANGRTFTLQDGTPVQMFADAEWFAINHGSQADLSTLYKGIGDLGYNAVLTSLLEHAGGGAWGEINAPNDLANNPPFLTPDQLDTPNDTYFDNVRLAIQKAACMGLQVVMFYTYAGYQGGAQGWEAVVTAAHNTNTVCFNWGVYLGNKFGDLPNVVWMNNGDHNQSGTALTRYQQILAGIQSITRVHQVSSELDNPNSLATSQSGYTYGRDPAVSDETFDWFYAWGPGGNGQTYTTALAAWDDTVATIPVIAGETIQIDAGFNVHDSREEVRTQYHWAMTSGAMGSNFGQTGRWNWQSGAAGLATLTSAGTLDASYAAAFYKSIPSWHLLRPSGTASGRAGRDLVGTGVGSGDTRVTSCMSSDGVSLLVYFPQTGASATQTAQVDLRSMAGPCLAEWWNPTDGTRTTSGGGATGGAYSLANSLSTASFTTPGSNGTRNDWVLRIQSAGGIAGTTTATITPAGTLVGAGALAGSTTATVTPTGALKGAGALAGATTAGLTQTGALTGTGALAGTTTAAVTPAGTLVGAGAAAGTTAVSVVPAGVLVGAGALGGSAVASLVPAGTLLGAGALVGATTATVTPSGILVGAGALAGSTALGLAPAATIVGFAPVSGATSLSIAASLSVGPVGSTTLTITASATLAAAGALVGATSLSLAPAATLLGAGALAGPAVPLSLAPAGTLGGLGFLQGSTSAAVTPTGLLGGAGALAGTTGIAITASLSLGPSGGTTLTVTASATLGGSAAAAGATSLALAPTGALAGLGALAGATTLSIAPTGTARGAGALVGTTTATVTPAATLVGAGALAGAVALGIDASLLTGIAGAAALALAASATLGGLGALAGSTSLSISASCDAFRGATSLSIATAGTLTAGGALVGTATLGVIPHGTGLLLGDGLMVGRTVLALDAVAITGAFAPLSGSTRLSVLRVTCRARGQGGHHGSATLRINVTGTGTLT